MGVVDPEFASATLRLWIAAGSAALLVAACVLASMSSRANLARALERSGVIVLGAILGAVFAWSALDRGAGRNDEADRRTLELRAEELTAHSLTPGSALPCLDAMAGEDVEAACEKALFASPLTVATATSYVEARLQLLDHRGGVLLGHCPFAIHGDHDDVDVAQRVQVGGFQQVVQVAFIDVNESGTEAAAATAVITGLESLKVPKIFHADHPFLYLIRDRKTGAVLFLGRVAGLGGEAIPALR